MIDYTQASLKVGNLGTVLNLACDTQSISPSSVIWLVTQNKMGLYVIDGSTSGYQVNNDGSLLIQSLNLLNEEYYTCGFLDSNGNLFTRSIYLVFVKSMSTWSLNNKIIDKLILSLANN